jgi:predicted ribosome quality control (RQC) complex YloA/Tae2 family protein
MKEENKKIEVEVKLFESTFKSANRYYEEAKRLEKKLERLKKMIDGSKRKVEKAHKIEIKKTEIKEKKEKYWFEKYHYGFTTNGKMILGGRDATSNEKLIKTYLEKEDLAFHADIDGAAHFVLKDGQKANEDEIKEVLGLVASYTKAWKSQFVNTDLYYVSSDQISKTAETGEFLSKGAFVIRGKRNWFRKVKLELAIGIINLEHFTEHKGKRLIAGTEELFKKEKSPILFKIVPGRNKKSDAAKKINAEIKKAGIKDIDLDEVMQALPPGNIEFVK